ncbi:hypothetical protein ACA910_006329 [Epithemia clementina (nom. ined.)]
MLPKICITAMMDTFHDTAGAQSVVELFELAQTVAMDTPNFYIGLYHHDGKECRRMGLPPSTHQCWAVPLNGMATPMLSSKMCRPKAT